MKVLMPAEEVNESHALFPRMDYHWREIDKNVVLLGYRYVRTTDKNDRPVFVRGQYIGPGGISGVDSALMSTSAGALSGGEPKPVRNEEVPVEEVELEMVEPEIEALEAQAEEEAKPKRAGRGKAGK